MSPRRNYDQYYRDADESYEKKPVLSQETTDSKAKKEIDKPVKAEQKMIELKKGKVVGGARLNVREKESTDSKIINLLANGENVTIVEGNTNPDWYKLQTGGYVMKKFIELV